MNPRMILITTGALLYCSAPSYAGSGCATAGVSEYYKKGDFQQVVLIGQKILAKNPADAVTRYYYAGALLKLGRRQEADKEYRSCYAASADETMKSYCVQALRSLSGRPTGAGSAGAGDAAATAPASQLSADGKPPAPELTAAERATLAKKVQVLEEGSKEIAFHRKLADEEIARAKTKAFEGLDNIPKLIYRPPYDRGMGTPYPNPEYEDALARSQEEERVAAAKINENFAREEARITEEYKRRASAYDHIGGSRR
jgi:hypothetical protein